MFFIVYFENQKKNHKNSNGESYFVFYAIGYVLVPPDVWISWDHGGFDRPLDLDDHKFSLRHPIIWLRSLLLQQFHANWPWQIMANTGGV